MNISQAARQTGLSAKQIRDYEKQGLLPQAARTAAGYRDYGDNDLQRLHFIRHARDLGFPLDSIRELLSLSDHPDMPCAAADVIARRQLQSVRDRIVRLEALQQELSRMLSQCAHGTISDCKVIEVLGDHAHCLHDHHGDGVPS